ncbi:MAG: DMT family transporter, partial [Pseudomonadota bacterium]
MSDPQPRPGVVDYAVLLALAALWGSSFLVIKFAVETIPAATLTLARLVGAAVLLFATAALFRQRLVWRRNLWVWLLLAAFFGNALPFMLIAWGQERIDSGVSAIIMAIMPLSTLVMAHIFTRDEKLSVPKVIAVALGFTGVLILIGPGKLATLGSETWRQLAVAGAATCYGLNAVISKQLSGQPSQALVAWLMAISTVMMAPIALAWDQPWQL